MRDIYASLFSVSALFVTTAATTIESIVKLSNLKASKLRELQKEDDIQWRWVLWIGVANLMLDIAAWTIFILSVGAEGDENASKGAKGKSGSTWDLPSFTWAATR